MLVAERACDGGIVGWTGERRRYRLRVRQSEVDRRAAEARRKPQGDGQDVSAHRRSTCFPLAHSPDLHPAPSRSRMSFHGISSRSVSRNVEDDVPARRYSLWAVAYFWVGVVPPVVEVVEPEPALPVVVVAPPVVVVAFVLVAPAPAPVYVAPPVLVEVEVVAPAPVPVLLVAPAPVPDLVAPAPAPVLLVVVFAPLLLVVEPLLLVLLVVEFELEPLPERPLVPDWTLTLGLERWVVTSRLPEPTVVPDRILLFESAVSYT